MFAGLQEILVLVVVILALFLLPRLLSRDNATKALEPSVSGMLSTLTGRLRLALMASLIWPLVIAAFFKPWQTGLMPFLYAGFLPVLLGWGIRWVVIGYRGNKK